jgi:RNA polymerase sigma-70 factor (ECF subfamily)
LHRTEGLALPPSLRYYKMTVERYVFDREYVEALRQNDLRVQQHFATYFRELLLIKLRRRVPNAEVAEDLTQETFLRVLTVLRADGLRNAASLGGFVDSVCNKVLLEYYRQGKRTTQMAEDAPEPVDGNPDPEQVFITLQRQQIVAQVLQDLGPKDRDLLRQVFLLDQDREEICQAYHVDREHLRVLLHRAKNRFRTLLDGAHRRAAAGG